MLSHKLALYDIDDVEAFCTSIFKPRAPAIPSRDHEDAIAYLIETTWELSLDYNAGALPSRFGFYAKRILARRLIDWQRRQYGRTKWTFGASRPGYANERPRPDLVSLEHRPNDPDHSLMDHLHTGRYEDALGLQRARDSQRSRSDKAGTRSAA